MSLDQAKEQFGSVVADQLARVQRMKDQKEWTDYAKLQPIILGVVPGDDIGPAIANLGPGL